MKPDEAALKNLESRAKIYAEERKKQQIEALEKALVDARSKLEAAKAKAAKKAPKDSKKGKDGKDEKGREDEKREPTAEELAVEEAEKKVTTAEKAKAQVEEAPPDVQPVVMLEQAGEFAKPMKGLDISRNFRNCCEV